MSFFKSSYEDENNLGQFVGEVRTVFKSELDKQVTQEARADKDSRIHTNKNIGNLQEALVSFIAGLL